MDVHHITEHPHDRRKDITVGCFFEVIQTVLLYFAAWQLFSSYFRIRVEFLQVFIEFKCSLHDAKFEKSPLEDIVVSTEERQHAKESQSVVSNMQ